MTLPENWSVAKKRLAKLPDRPLKMQYLLEVMAECRHSEIPGSPDELARKELVDKFWPAVSAKPRFELQAAIYRKCEIEMQKLKDQAALDPRPEPAGTEATRNPEFTTARQVLAMYYIFESAKIISVSYIDKARFIEFLTGKNLDNITKCLAKPQKEKRSENVKDLRCVRQFFEKLKMTEVLKMIDRDIVDSG